MFKRTEHLFDTLILWTDALPGILRNRHKAWETTHSPQETAVWEATAGSICSRTESLKRKALPHKGGPNTGEKGVLIVGRQRVCTLSYPKSGPSITDGNQEKAEESYLQKLQRTGLIMS